MHNYLEWIKRTHRPFCPLRQLRPCRERARARARFSANKALQQLKARPCGYGLGLVHGIKKKP